MGSSRRGFIASVVAAVVGRNRIAAWFKPKATMPLAAAPSGLFGIEYYQITGNAGSFMGISRAAYPGRIDFIDVNKWANSGMPRT